MQEKKAITKEEFDMLKQGSSEAILRDSYLLSYAPNLSIKIYHGRFEGLARAEVEFPSDREAKAFAAPSWMGAEMTGLPIARDVTLLDLSPQELAAYITPSD